MYEEELMCKRKLCDQSIDTNKNCDEMNMISLSLTKDRTYIIDKKNQLSILRLIN